MSRFMRRRTLLAGTATRCAVACLTAVPAAQGLGAQAPIASTGATADAAASQSFPRRPVRLIVPIAPGGGTDILSRIIAQKMTESLGQQVVVDNRAGAGSIIGTDIVAKSAPDGYTLLMAFPAHAINMTLFGKLPFHPIKDFSAVTACASSPYILALHPSVQAKSVRELIALARAKPALLNYASAGNGSSPHLAAELFKTMAKVSITGVPYNGGGPAIAATLAGETHMTFGVISAALPHVKAGKLVGLAVTSLERSKLTPELPTVAEAGVPGYEAIAWYGVLAPARTPATIIARLDHEFQRILQLPDVQERLAGLGFEPIPTTPAKFAALIEAEIPKWAKVIKDAGIRPD